MANASFGKSLKNGGAIGTDKLENILLSYPELSPDWLLTGNGPMLRDQLHRTYNRVEDEAEASMVVREPADGRPCSTAHPATTPSEGIPLIPANAMAGILTSDVSIMDYECERYVIPDFRGADFLITVKGDSMLPTYHPGDLVACRRIPLSDRFFQWGKAYVVDTNQGPLIKRINPSPEAEAIILLSDNAAYGPITMPASYVRAVALVIGIVRLE